MKILLIGATGQLGGDLLRNNPGHEMVAPGRDALDLARPAGAAAAIRRLRPELVLGFGGYTSFPVLMAAKALRIPTMLHEQNVVPGKANRWMASQVDVVAISFPETEHYLPKARKKVVTGNPIRTSVERECREEALKFFGFSPDKKTLLVWGAVREPSPSTHFFYKVYRFCLRRRERTFRFSTFAGEWTRGTRRSDVPRKRSTPELILFLTRWTWRTERRIFASVGREPLF